MLQMAKTYNSGTMEVSGYTSGVSKEFYTYCGGNYKLVATRKTLKAAINRANLHDNDTCIIVEKMYVITGRTWEYLVYQKI